MASPTHAAGADGGVREVRIAPTGLEGLLGIPPGAGALVVFAHGSGSSRLSPRNNQVAAALRQAGLATLLFDLLLPEEAADRHNVFDIDLLAERLLGATGWLRERPDTRDLTIGYFGASTGAAAALVAAARAPASVGAVVSRGGRPDMAGAALAGVRCPTLLIVGGDDHAVLDLNRTALDRLTCEKRLEIVPGAGHLFEEPGALDRVIELARAWFVRHLRERAGA
ncbi:MAG TPA: dienelactone hydrolase family protein [Geminicoccaceae bacterium]|nr:dienelactone hydrolase family protein [Geminicoccaceae bacterium]